MGSVNEWKASIFRELSEEFERVKADCTPYEGDEVFINRDGKARSYHKKFKDGENKEKRLVYELYYRVHHKCGGSLYPGGEPVLLISFEVPNQGGNKQKQRRADLLGLSKNGGLVVFECKRAENKKDSPLKAAMQGLDYLSHLLIPGNFERLKTGFADWREKHLTGDKMERDGEGSWWSPVAEEFRKVELCRDVPHSVIVLAPDTYYEKWRKQDARWQDLSARKISCDGAKPGFRIDFATCNFDFTKLNFPEAPCKWTALD